MTTRTGAREACDTCPRLTFNGVGEDGRRRCAECLFAEDDRRPSWLSSAGVIANGGIRPPGTEGLASSKGATKHVTKINKDTSFTTNIPARPVEAPKDKAKPITGGRATAEGLYRFGDTLARIKRSASGHLYVLVKNAQGGWDYEGRAPLAKLRSADRIDEVTATQGPAKPAITEGWFRHGDTVAEVVRGNRGYLYATLLDVHTGRFEFISGLIRKLDPAARLTLAEAVEMGKRFHRCMCCGRELTKQESIDRGIGPICAGKL